VKISEELIARFKQLLEAARQAGDSEPTAMTLATADTDGRVSARTVLLKDVDRRGFIFYTNLGSHKGQQLSRHPQAALLFLWKTLQQQVQVKVEGRVQLVPDAEADAYFALRPRDSQLGAWASLQSETLPQRELLLERMAQYRQQYDGLQVPRPPYWSGFVLDPDMLEFWFGQPFRLHLRERFEARDGSWVARALYP